MTPPPPVFSISPTQGAAWGKSLTPGRAGTFSSIGTGGLDDSLDSFQTSDAVISDIKYLFYAQA